MMRPRSGLGGFGPAGDAKSALPLATLGRLVAYLTRGCRLQLVLVLASVLTSAFAGVAGALFLKVLIDRYIAPLIGAAHPDFSGLAGAIGIMAGVYSVGVAGTFLCNRLMVVIGQSVQKRIRDDLFAHMQTLPVRYFDEHSFGDVMSHYTNDIDTLRQMLSQSAPMLFTAFATVAFVFAAMLYTSWLLTAQIALMIAAMLLVTRWIGGKSRTYFARQQNSLGALDGYIEEMMNGQKVVKVFCHEKEEMKRFDALSSALCDDATRANQYANVLMPLTIQIGNFNYVFIAIAGGVLSALGIGGLTLGGIASFLQLSRNVTMPISQVSQQFNAVIMALAGAERIFALMDEPPEADDGSVTLVNVRCETGGETLVESGERTGFFAWKRLRGDGSAEYVRLAGDVLFSDVSFGYDDRKTVLHNVSILARPGEKIAFVGQTGAGKTTIANLINRFYDVRTGRVRYDGIDIGRIKKSDLRRAVGVILQETNLFTESVRENIRYGRLDATDAEVEAAARLAGADDFISRLSSGYETILSGAGGGLSQGQCQLLSIARAAVADPPVLIMDEATSSIDTRTEAIVQRGMDSLMRGRTVFVIAHRLSTVRNADRIVVLHEGRVIEQGAHAELMAKKGRYYELATGARELD